MVLRVEECALSKTNLHWLLAMPLIQNPTGPDALPRELLERANDLGALNARRPELLPVLFVHSRAVAPSISAASAPAATSSSPSSLASHACTANVSLRAIMSEAHTILVRVS